MKKLLLVFILIASKTQAAEVLNIYTSTRALGMGGAFTAIASGQDALFYNPAGLAKTKGFDLTIMDIKLGADGLNAFTAYQNFQNANGNVLNQLNSLFGQQLWMGAGGKTAFVGPGFGVSFFDMSHIALNMANPAFPNFNIDLINDYGGNVGFAFEPVPGLSVGTVVSRITRFGSVFPIGASTLANLNNNAIVNQLSNQGVGYGVDFGANFVMPMPSKPTFSFVWKNVGTTTFSLDTGTIRPPQIQDNITWAYGMNINLPGLDINPALDFTNTNRTDIDLSKKVNFGIEFAFPVISIRGGFHQGYYTLGVGTTLGAFHIDAATYGEELGVYASQQEDRRYLIEFSIDLSFDPNGLFGIGSKGGKNGAAAGVKQRR